MRFVKCARCDHKYCEFCYCGDKFSEKDNTQAHHYKYELNNNYTGEVILYGDHSDDDIRLAIMDDLYSVWYEEI